jgi:amidase
MNRRDFLSSTTVAALTGANAAASSDAPTRRARSARGSVAREELTLADIAAACADGHLTSRHLTQLYLERIEALDRQGPELRAVLETNPRALEIAAALDEERRSRGPRGPLHGIPILIKDNIQTADRMMTTAGSLALEGWYAPEDAPLVARLRAAGAVILGKTNLSEWANFRSTHPSSGWSARGGQTRNPYALNRSPSGSSSGSAVAVAANLCAMAVGTETDGSIVSPASINGIVGLKPTVGLISRSGIIPLSHSQDTAGPFARTVRDVAVLFGAMAGPDPSDTASTAVGARFEHDYVRFLDTDGLRGARLGIARRFFADSAPLNRFLDGCVALLMRAGASIVDPADLPMHDAATAPEQEVLLYEFKAGLNAYLARLPSGFKVRSLSELIRFNEEQADRELSLFDQERLRQAEAKGGLEEAAYREARERCLTAMRSGGIDAVLCENNLDAIVSLTTGPAWPIDAVNGDSDGGGACSTPAAVSGYPHITVPAGLFRGLPIGLSFFGTAFSEAKLLRLASGFEHVAAARSIPKFLQSI